MRPAANDPHAGGRERVLHRRQRWWARHTRCPMAKAKRFNTLRAANPAARWRMDSAPQKNFGNSGKFSRGIASGHRFDICRDLTGPPTGRCPVGPPIRPRGRRNDRSYPVAARGRKAAGLNVEILSLRSLTSVCLRSASSISQRWVRAVCVAPTSFCGATRGNHFSGLTLARLRDWTTRRRNRRGRTHAFNNLGSGWPCTLGRATVSCQRSLEHALWGTSVWGHAVTRKFNLVQ
jgi:hypothetical protein